MNTAYMLLIIVGIITSIFTAWKKKYLLAGSSAVLSTAIFVFFSYFHKENKEQIVVAIATDYAPFAYVENGEIKGIDVDLLKHIGKDLNKQIVLKPVAFEFLSPTVMKGDADIAAGGLSITEERESVLWKEHLHFTTAYSYSSTGILTHGFIKPQNLTKDFNGKILVQSGSLFVAIVKERFPNATIVSREDFNIALEEFKSGKADAIVGDALALVYFNKKHLEKNFSIFKLRHKITAKSSKGNAFLVNKNNKKLELDNINNLIIKYKKDKKLLQELENLKTI